MKLIDTTFLIDLLRGRKETLKVINSKEDLLTTQINMFEVIRGLFLKKISSSRFLEVSELFQDIRVLPLDDNSIIKSAEISSSLIKEGGSITDADCFIAGITLSNRINTIITKNKKHFDRIKEIKVETY